MRAYLLLPAMLLFACDPSECEDCFDPPPCNADGVCLPGCGVASLAARTTNDDYEAATISFKHATVQEDGEVGNDWDLLFGNDQDAGYDLFTVNMVVDDRSMIVDLGDLITICDVPAQLDPSAYPVGMYGDHDSINVLLDHIYLIRTVDTDTRQYALVQVLEHQPNQSVKIRWYRSPEPDRFVPPAACAAR